MDTFKIRKYLIILLVSIVLGESGEKLIFSIKFVFSSHKLDVHAAFS